MVERRALHPAESAAEKKTEDTAREAGGSLGDDRGPHETPVAARLHLITDPHPDADEDVNGVVFVLYLLGLAATPPVAAWWARGEPSRAGSGVVVVAGLLVPFLLLRLDTLWGGGA